VVADPRTAFVTGGSGFIGGHLIRRLIADGARVRAIARSERAAAKVKDAGAEAMPGGLGDQAELRAAAEGCDVAFHCAATVSDWGRPEEFSRGTVDGTRNALAACRAAGVGRFVHVGTEAALLAGEPLRNVDEGAPLRPDSKAPYSASKAQAEQLVRDANDDGLTTVVVRPRLVWGPGDGTILPGLVEAVRSGRFRWVDGGRHLTSTTHVENAVEGLVLAGERGRPGGVYFVSDGEPIVFRDFVTELLATQGVAVPDRSIPLPIARAAATVLEAIWRTLRLSSPPPITRMAFWLSGLETTVNIGRAREELGYRPIKTIDEGMAELRDLATKPGATRP
jgi:nucleoside-diphosphate-sugar epimerase